VFLTVLHRLMGGGSDRAAERWREDYRIAGTDELELHQLYRAMAWLGEVLPEPEPDSAPPFAPRCVKDLIEERLFQRTGAICSRPSTWCSWTRPASPLRAKAARRWVGMVTRRITGRISAR
jgi:hypothetical protein